MEEININELLLKYNENAEKTRLLDKEKEKLKNQIKIYLKEHRWTNYSDKDSGINVSLVLQKRESIDLPQLKIMLNDAQYSQVIRITTFEKMLITNKDDRKRISKYVKN